MKTDSGGKTLQWVSSNDGRVLSNSVRVADSFVRRLIGLQFSRSMPVGESLWLTNCRSIHTAWMRFTIDVYFLDESYCIIDVHRQVRPWRIATCRGRKPHHVVETQMLLDGVAPAIGTETQFVKAEQKVN